MTLNESQLESVFPYRNNYHDVVHLTPRGHTIVAEQVMEERFRKVLGNPLSLSSLPL